MIISSDHDAAVFLVVMALCVIALTIASEIEARAICRTARAKENKDRNTLHLWRMAGLLTVGIVSVAGWTMLFQILKA